MDAAPLSDAFHVLDLTGVLTSAVLGGGLIRDTLLQHGPPIALTDYRYLVTALVGAQRTLSFGLGWLSAILLGTITAVGGAMVRDVVLRQVGPGCPPARLDAARSRRLVAGRGNAGAIPATVAQRTTCRRPRA